MKLIDLTQLTHYMSPKSRLYWQDASVISPVAQVKFAASGPNLIIVTGQHPMTLSQLQTRLQDMSSETQLFAPDGQPIFGFHLQLEHPVPHIVLK